MKKQIQTKILKKLNISQSLMVAIKEQNHRFSERDLLVMIAQYSKTYDDKLQLLEFLKSEAEDKSIKIWADKYITYQKRCLEEFSKPAENTVFTVITGDSGSERYHAPTFEDALNVAKFAHMSFKEYEDEKQKFFVYRIEKTRLLKPKKLSEFDSDDCLGSCEVDRRGRLLDVDYYGIYNEWYDKQKRRDCDKCKRPCVEQESFVHFPPFLKEGDLVSVNFKRVAIYTQDDLTAEDVKRYNGKVYGIMAFDMPKEPKQWEDDSCIEMLTSPEVKERRVYEKDEFGYYICFHSHDHIKYPYIEKEDPAQVPEEVRADYEYYLEFLKENLFNKEK